MQLSPTAKAKLIQQFPELRDWLETRETNQLLSGLFSQIKMMKGDKGEKGDAGYTPQKGKDYFTDTEVNSLIAYILKQATPKKGVHYNDGEKGDAYVLTSKDKKEIAQSIDVPIVEKIIEKIEVVKEVMPKSIDVSIVKNAVSKKDLETDRKEILSGMAKVDGRIKLIDQRWHGGGLSQVYHDTTLSGTGSSSNPLTVIGGGGSGSRMEIPTGIVNDSNVSFAFTNLPVILVINGLTYRQSGGMYNWTVSGKTITLNNPIGVSGSIFGISGGLFAIEVSGTIDDSNTSFTSTIQPEYLSFSGLTAFQESVLEPWSYSNGAITTTNAVGVGGSLFGISGITLVFDPDGLVTGIV